jgi:myo-inositol-1(or 4)-monophosphatase
MEEVSLMNLDSIKRTAIAAAYQGAQVLRSRFGHISDIRKKAAAEIVTEADTESEKQIISAIHAKFPDHGVLSEECGLRNRSSEYQWIIDPLDGTLNFAHQVPIFCISIAVSRGDDIVLGVVLNPVNGELFSAERGKGAQLNGKPIHVSSVLKVSESLLVTGFPYDVYTFFDDVIYRYGTCLKAAQGTRRLGSAALHLCFVASGRFEGFWEQDLKAWDTAAGVLIATEAGAAATTFSNQPYTPGAQEILVTNGHIHEEMLGLLKIKGMKGDE